MITFVGEGGSNASEAIIIKDAKNELEGIEGEYIWLEENLGEQDVDWELVSQESINMVDKQYDVLKIKLTNSTFREVWFDITEFYGK